MREGPIHFSMIRSFALADLFTIANGCAGVVAIFQAMRFVAHGDPRMLWLATALIPVAAVFDWLDGRVARWRHAASPMGRELDSLADVISFGVAPAVIAFAAGADTALDQAILVYFVACGVSRLARYNVTAGEIAAASGKVTWSEGTSIPTSLVPLFLTMLAAASGSLLPVSWRGLDLHLVTLLFAISGSLMISRTIRIPKL